MRLKKLNYISNEFNKYKKSNDVEGYLYMISNPLHMVYNIPIYIINKKSNAYERFSEKNHKMNKSTIYEYNL